MRVHPSILAPRVPKWHMALVGAVLLVVLGVTLFRGPQKAVVAAPAQAPEKKIDVLVARELIQPGQLLEEAKIVTESRPVNTLPADAVTSFDALKNKVAAGPIPAGYPIAMALLAEPVAAAPVVEENKAEAPPEDPIEILLKEIEKKTVAMPVTFVTESPPRGARVAVTLMKGRGESVLLLEDCWIGKSSGKEAILRLEPAQALIMQSARSYGNFGFIELPREGSSPYVGKGISNEGELKVRMEGESKPQVVKAEAKENVTGYAWVSGEGVRYGIDKNGKIKVVNPE